MKVSIFPLGIIASAILAGLKLTGTIAISWWLVATPIFIVLAIYLMLAMFAVAFMTLACFLKVYGHDFNSGIDNSWAEMRSCLNKRKKSKK